jgi:hypothetical protein
MGVIDNSNGAQAYEEQDPSTMGPVLYENATKSTTSDSDDSAEISSGDRRSLKKRKREESNA